jgi:TolA-binding protein
MVTSPFRPVVAAAILATLILAAPSATAQDAPGDTVALRSYYSANGLLNRGMYELAAAEYRTFIEAHPDHEKAAVARYGLGVCLYRLQRNAEAIEALAGPGAAADFPYAAEALTIIGQCHLAENAPAEAVPALRRVLSRHADHGLADDAAALLAEALYLAGDHDAVEVPARLIAERWPDSARRERAELFRGLASMARGRYDEAARHFDEQLRLFPDGEHAAQATLLLGQCHHRAGRAAPAIERYRRVIREAVEAFVPEARYGLAMLLYEAKDPKAAAGLLDALLAESPDSELVPAARLLRGRIALDLGKTRRARTLFEQVAKSGARPDDSAFWLAKCDLAEGDPKAAARRLKRGIERHPKSPLVAEMTYDLAVARIRAGDHRGGIEAIDRFLAAHPRHALVPDAIHLAAATEHDRKRYAESQERCQAFAARHAKHVLMPSVAFLAAENDFLRGEHAKAVEGYRRLLRDHPDHPQRRGATYRLGMALYQLERFDEAEAVLASVASDDAAGRDFDNASLALGDLAFQRGAWREAERHFLAYLDRPDGPVANGDDALMKVGLARHRDGRHAEAIEAYGRLLAEHAESAHRLQAQFEMGQALVALERDAAAAASFRAVLDADAGSRFAVHALNHLGAIALRAGDLAAAADAYGRVVGATDDTTIQARALLRRGEALMTLSQSPAPASAITRRRCGPSPACAAARRRASTRRCGRPSRTRRRGCSAPSIATRTRPPRTGGCSICRRAGAPPTRPARPSPRTGGSSWRSSRPTPAATTRRRVSCAS